MKNRADSCASVPEVPSGEPSSHDSWRHLVGYGSGVVWLLWFAVLGPGAFIVAAVVAATVPPRPSWLVWQVVAGVLAIVLAWRVGEWAGAYADEDAEGCSDCGEAWGFALLAMVASCTAWLVGTALGGVIRFVVRR